MFKFSEEQNRFLESSGKVVLHACPGSGKTTVVAQKLANYLKKWNKPHQGIAVLSFTNVASNEIVLRVSEMLPEGFSIENPHFVGTLDSFIDNYIFLRFGYLLLNQPKRPRIVSSDIVELFPYWKGDCHRSCLSSIGDFRWNSKGELTKKGKKITCSKIGQYERPCIQFKKGMLEKGQFFQDEVAGFACKLLEEYPEIAKCIASRFPVIILDEAQDTSQEQMKLLDLLCDAGLKSMYIVGDPDQSIYEWRNANPESFLKKMGDSGWQQLALTRNFRSSQLICNATYVFSNIYKDKKANEASGQFAGYEKKPMLLLYEKGTSKSSIVERFKEECVACDISFTPDKVAVVSRGKIHSGIVENLWKTAATEFLAKASFEWISGNRGRAYSFCEKALFQLIVKDNKDIDISIEQEISRIFPYDQWKHIVIETLTKLPSATEKCGQWTVKAQAIIQEMLTTYNLTLIRGAVVSDLIKIKTRDKKNPNFKQTPIEDYFETKSQTEYTYSSVHGVKGQTFDAIMLLTGVQGSTLTPFFLADGDIDRELMRIAYVAMTRPRKLLVIAMPKTNARLDIRFPRDKWDYIEI